MVVVVGSRVVVVMVEVVDMLLDSSPSMVVLALDDIYII